MDLMHSARSKHQQLNGSTHHWRRRCRRRCRGRRRRRRRHRARFLYSTYGLIILSIQVKNRSIKMDIVRIPDGILKLISK